MIEVQPQKSFTTVVVTLFSITAGTVSLSTQSADVYVAPAVNVSVGYDDNVRLDPVEPDGQSRLIAIAQAEIGSRTPTRDAIFNAAAHVQRYSDSELDRTDWFFDLNLLRRWQRDELGLLTRYRRASTLTTELEDTGQVQVNRLRQDWSIAPSWTRRHTERTDTTLQYEFLDTTFEDGPEVGLFDFRNHRVDASIVYRLSETTRLNGRADYQRFESEDTTDSDNVGILVGLDRDFSPTLQAGLGLGARYTETEFFAEDDTKAQDSDSGPLYEANLTWTLEKSTLLVNGSRRVAPSGQGNLSDVELIQATWTRSLTRAYELVIDAGASRQEFAPSTSQAPEDRMYYNAGVQIAWHGRPGWRIDLAYRYRRQEFEMPQLDVDTGESGDSAESNAVFLTIRYDWTRIGLFR